MIPQQIHHRIIKQALTIRSVEEKFLTLFSEGKLNGTVHTCVGQEFSALAFAGQLQKRDFVFSNHRCHGHYIAFTNDVKGLMAELLGKASGTSGGIGSSQHLCNNNFFSNGIQGGIVPVAAGYALANKLSNNAAIGVVYIGDGTLGEGVLYETFNIISKWKIPLLVVCENNFYAQSTPQSINLAGDIRARAEAFGIKTFKGNTSAPENLLADASLAIEYVRSQTMPAFYLVDTYRLNPHSKGDDDRDPAEIEENRTKDYLTIFEKNYPEYFNKYTQTIQQQIDALVQDILLEKELPIDAYYIADKNTSNLQWQELQKINKRQVELLNTFFKEKVVENERLVFLGEDILSPYGGAFKVTKELSFIAPTRVFSTPISEAAITGIANGLALNGYKPFAEIMFGDFVTLAFDQIVNHASKFYHMFNKKVTCPVVIRTPMGGRRGYGPTHSQTLDKFLVGIDNITTVAINTFFDPTIIYTQILNEQHPVVVIENKTDYGKKILHTTALNFVYEKNNDAYPVVKIRPAIALPTITIIAYGGMADLLNQMLQQIFVETDWLPELIVPSKISQLPIDIIVQSLQQTKKLLIVEEGSAFAGIGAELIAQVVEQIDFSIAAKRIAAHPVPIPSVKSLEHIVLPEKERIINEIKANF